MSVPLNEREKILVDEVNEKGKNYKSADILISWREGKIVDAKITESMDKALIKETH